MTTDERKGPVSPDKGNPRMGKVRKEGNKLELAVREVVTGLGYVFEMNAADLPGKPDLVFRDRSKVIFVHGCFWHQHPGCPRAVRPKSNMDFWLPKLAANQERDFRDQAALREQGWDILVIWADELKMRDRDTLTARIRQFLGDVA